MRAEAGAEANNDKAIAADTMMRDMVTSNVPTLTDWSPVAQTWFRRNRGLAHVAAKACRALDAGWRAVPAGSAAFH
jgi:hypothetical protein